MKRYFILTLTVALCAAMASAQLRFGVKAGIGLNNIKFEQDALDADNRMGFTGGVMLEWETPLTGLCLDASALYTHRSAKFLNETYFKRDFIDIPLLVKIKFPIAGNQNFKPFFFTGPDFAILVNHDDDQDDLSFSNFATSWNIGAGIELFRHLQLAATYGMGMNKSIKGAFNDVKDGASLGDQVKGTDRFWTITAAYLF